MSERRVYEGKVVVFRTSRMRRGWPDLRKPPWTMVLVLTDEVTRSDHRWQIRFDERSPVHHALIAHEGCRVRVRCSIREYGNSLGAHALRAKFDCLNPDEHVLSVLAGRGEFAPLASGAKR